MASLFKGAVGELSESFGVWGLVCGGQGHGLGRLAGGGFWGGGGEEREGKKRRNLKKDGGGARWSGRA